MQFHERSIKIKLEKTLIGTSGDSVVKTVTDKLELTPEGIPGDRHFGYQRKSGGRESRLYDRGTAIRNNRQWSALSDFELRHIAGILNIPEVSPEALGANFVFSGIKHLTKLPPLSYIVFDSATNGPVTLVVYSANGPCIHPGRVLADQFEDPALEKAFPKAALNCRGIVGWIENGGVLLPGDDGEIKFPQFIDESKLESLF